MRSLDADFISRKNAKENKPIFLYHIHEYDGSNDLFLAEYDADVTFDSQVYTRFPIKHEHIEDTSQGQINGVKVIVANVNRLFQAYVEAYDFRGKQVDIIHVWADKLDDPYAKMVDTFFIDGYSCDEKTIAFNLTSKMDVIELQLPARRYLRTHCYWKFKGTECAYAGAEASCNRTFQRCKELANQERFGSFPSIPFRNIYVA
jgi:lambda family phage minor tail protein L